MPSKPNSLATKILIFVLIVPLYTCSYGQTDTLTKEKPYNNALSFAIAGTNFLYSINYTHFLKENTLGTLASDLRLTYSRWISALNYSVQEYLGKGNHHLVVGVGYTFNRNDGYILSSKTVAAPSFDLGYCYRNPHRRFTFGIYFQPYYDEEEYQPWGGVILGYNFDNPVKALLPRELYRSGEREFNLSVGAEASVGKGNLDLEHIGDNTVSTFTTSVFIKYYLQSIYLKAIIGQYTLNDNIVEKNDTRFEVLKSNPSFVIYGIGIGIPLIKTKGWCVSPEMMGGKFYSDHKLTIKPVDLPFEGNDNLDYNISQISDNETTPYFIKAGLNITRSVFSFMDIHAGGYYSNSCMLIGSLKGSTVKLKSNECQIVLGLQFHIL
jgi:hypothetical protein